MKLDSRRHTRRLALALLAATLAPITLQAAIPEAMPYQGRVAVAGTNFTGTGQFKFAVYEHATGTFTPATATATLSGGSLVAVSLSSGGRGYSAGVTVSFTGGGGTNATATVSVVNSVVTAVTVTAPGSGYTSVPTVVFNEPTAPTQLWNNTAGTTNAALAAPANAVSIPVVNGLYALGLGDTALANMAALPTSLIPVAGKRAFVRVWFDDGTHGSQILSPDTELRSVPFAREAATAASIGGVAIANLARLNTSNTFAHVNGLTVTGVGPINNTTPGAGATIPFTGPGTRLEFLPGYGAFRAGTVTSTQWDAPSIGLYSTALGYDTVASGTFSTALGANLLASGDHSTALGFTTVASGNYAIALGTEADASGDNSVALGTDTTASGAYATALGLVTQARGTASTAMGSGTIAWGDKSTALGSETSATSGYETALGRFNTVYTPASTSGWNTADRLLVIGKGTENTARLDALVMLKSGNTTLNGSLRMNTLDGLAVSGAGPSGGTPSGGTIVPLTGGGTRMEFVPGYSAFRAGTVTGTQWDAANIGTFSVALGYNTTASGFHSTAWGDTSTASGGFSTASGYGTVASGNTSTVWGDTCTASGDYTTVWGRHSTADGYCATATGYHASATGEFAIAMGNYTTASGASSVALGANTAAESACETVVGSCNTDATPYSTTSWDSRDRLFVIGNGRNSVTRSDALVVFKNGNATLQGALTQGSDRNRKTDIVPADTAAVLAKVAALPLATWKYKDEAVTHLGPMAQDFFAAFQLGGDERGIASVDADGVALAAIQELKKQLDAKDARITALEARLAALEAKLAP